jgi:tetratricopeptide (TPR) repeat protein
VADEIALLSEEVAREPEGLAFLRLGELLRARGQLDAAARVVVGGLRHHPYLAEAHDLYARILVDRGEFELAEEEWGMVLAIDPRHAGAHRGLGFLAYKKGDLDAALDHLELALSADPADRRVVNALRRVRKEYEDWLRIRGSAVSPVAAPPSDVFAGLEGAGSGILLADVQGRVLAGAMRTEDGIDVAEEVAAHLAGVSQEAARTTHLLGLGRWRFVLAEGERQNLYLSEPVEDMLLLLARDRSVPAGRLAVVAQRAAQVATRWLEAQQ